MKKFGIRNIENLAKFSKADIHIHSNFSDGQASIEEILDYVEKRTDLDVIAIAGHDTIERAVLAKKFQSVGGFTSKTAV